MRLALVTYVRDSADENFTTDIVVIQSNNFPSDVNSIEINAHCETAWQQQLYTSHVLGIFDSESSAAQHDKIFLGKLNAELKNKSKQQLPLCAGCFLRKPKADRKRKISDIAQSQDNSISTASQINLRQTQIERKLDGVQLQVRLCNRNLRKFKSDLDDAVKEINTANRELVGQLALKFNEFIEIVASKKPDRDYFQEQPSTSDNFTSELSTTAALIASSLTESADGNGLTPPQYDFDDPNRLTDINASQSNDSLTSLNTVGSPIAPENGAPESPMPVFLTDLSSALSSTSSISTDIMGSSPRTLTPDLPTTSTSMFAITQQMVHQCTFRCFRVSTKAPAPTSGNYYVIGNGNDVRYAVDKNEYCHLMKCCIDPNGGTESQKKMLQHLMHLLFDRDELISGQISKAHQTKFKGKELKRMPLCARKLNRAFLEVSRYHPTFIVPRSPGKLPGYFKQAISSQIRSLRNKLDGQKKF